MNNLLLNIQNKNWQEIVKKYPPIILAEKLSFNTSLSLSRQLLENEEFDEQIQTFAINFIKIIREIYLDEWSASWKYDAYLGYAYDLRGWDYEEQFDTYMRALEKSSQNHPEVLMRLAMNWNCPGIYKDKIDEKQAIQILEEALTTTPYIEGVSCLINLYKHSNINDKILPWQMKLEKSLKDKLFAPYAFLDFFDVDFTS